MHALYVLLAAIAFSVALVVGYGVLRIEQCKNIFRAWSKFIASLCGCSGFHTLSAECGSRGRASLAWACAAGIIDAFLGEGHCLNAAEREGLV